MPKTKTIDDIAKDRANSRSHAMAQAVVSAFAETLTNEAKKHGGFLGLRHIEQLNAEFQQKANDLAELFEQAFQDAHREQEELKWHAIKRPAFDRLMVKRFQPLFFARNSQNLPQGKISRRVLPGFFLALNMMTGPEILGNYQRRSDEAVKRIMADKTPVDWHLVDLDMDVRDLILDAQYTIASYCEEPQQRIDWFINIINSNLAPAHEGAMDSDWEIDRMGMRALIRAILSDLALAIEDNVMWARLAMRHDGADRDHMRTVISNYN